MSTYVFLGPSLPRERAAELLDARYLPPVRMGDVYALVERRATAIVIIDGYFENTPAVWHKEILFALSQGVRVFGGGSMGALRAAELHAFGMEGIGRIFESYASGETEDDDEVAVAHGPAELGFPSLSQAMVNVRHALRLAAERGAITEATRELLERAAKDAFYPERSWQLLYDAARANGVPESETRALRAFLETDCPDLKREDAETVLRTVARELRERAPARAPFAFEPTLFWEHLQTMWRPAGEAETSATVSREQVRNHVRLCEPERLELRRNALLLVLAQNEARRSGVTVDDVKGALERFRRERGLLGTDALGRWIEREHATREDVVELATAEALVGAVERRLAEKVDAMLPAALKLEGRYGEIVARVRAKWDTLRALDITNPTADDAQATVDDVLAWYQQRHGRVHTALDAHVAELGFGSPRQFMHELLAEYITAKAEPPDSAVGQRRAVAGARPVGAQRRGDERGDRGPENVVAVLDPPDAAHERVQHEQTKRDEHERSGEACDPETNEQCNHY